MTALLAMHSDRDSQYYGKNRENQIIAFKKGR
jgi:hypothetical protein